MAISEILLAYWGNIYGISRATNGHTMTGYYDLVLVLIPVALLGIGGTLLAAGVPQPIAVSLAGAASVGMIGHAIFVNGPVASADSTTSADAQPASTGSAGASVQAD